MGMLGQITADRAKPVVSIVKSLVRTSAGPVEVACCGDGEGDVLILVGHGLGGWTSLVQIALQLVESRPGLRILAWSRAGPGREPVAAMTEPLFYEASVILPALMDALHIPAANFLAHANGATVAMIFAGLFPERTSGIVALAPYGVADSHQRAVLEALPIAEIDDQFQELISADYSQPTLAYQKWRQQRISECDRNWSAMALFAQISAPLVVVQGALDRFANMSQVNAISDCILGPVNWIILRNAGYLMHIEAPEQIASLVLLHLKNSVVPPV